MILILALLISLNVQSNSQIKEQWLSCQKDSDCKIVRDMGCGSRCKTGAINKVHSTDLNKNINKRCADVLTPEVLCAADYRNKVAKCIKNRCEPWYNHPCCVGNPPKHLRCDIKKVTCKLFPINPKT